MLQFDFPSKFYQRVCPVPIQNNIHCWWIEIKKRPKYKLHDKIGDLLKTTFWYHNNDTKRNGWFIFWSHWPINDLSSCLLFTWQLCYKPLGILQRVTKSQKVHIWRFILKIKYMWRRWSTPQDFFLAFTDELSKTRKIKILQKWKKTKTKTKTKKKKLVISSFYTCVPKTTIRCSPRDTEWHNLILSCRAIFDHLRPLSSLNPRKPKFWKKEKSIWRCHHFKLVQQKTQSNDVCLLRYGVCQTQITHLPLQGIFFWKIN